MGVRVYSPNHEFYTGYITFDRMRTAIADLLGEWWGNHYRALTSLYESVEYEHYDEQTNAKYKEMGANEQKVVEFIYMSDCEGHLDVVHCRSLVLVMGERYDMWRDDTRSWAYAAHEPFTLHDFNEMLLDGIDTGEGVRWT